MEGCGRVEGKGGGYGEVSFKQEGVGGEGRKERLEDLKKSWKIW